MIVNDLDVIRLTCLPAEAYSPLVVDANAVLTTSIALERFWPIAGWRPEIIQTRGPMQQQQLAACGSLDRAEPRHQLIAEQSLRLAANESP
jgi:hypothetical protein